jgi:hypothetical protein
MLVALNALYGACTGYYAPTVSGWRATSGFEM